MNNLNLERLSYFALCALSNGVIITNNKGQVIFLNKVAENLTGCENERAEGKNIEDVFVTYLEDGYTQYIPHLIESYYQIDLPDYLIIRNHADQVKCYITGTISYIENKENNFTGYVLLFRDVSYQKQKETAIQYSTFHDTLTGLYNRVFFEVELERLSSARMMPLSVIMADVNGLKLVNDVFGHQEGDELQKKIAQVLRKACRQEDIIARTGGDEFVILLPKVDKEGARAIEERIRLACKEAQVYPIPLSLSLGSATRDNKQISINATIKLAEERMYTAKLRENCQVRSEMISFISKNLEKHAGETKEYALQLKEICIDMAQRLGLGEYEKIQLELLITFHDIGKIAIPNTILLKPGELELEEWHIVRKHSEIGYRIAIYFPKIAIIANAILSHHERWDGKGYPQGLSGDQIPVNSRILAIAETYVVLTNGSPYRAPVSSMEAIKEIQRCSGTQFDPELVEHFTYIMSQKVAMKAQ
jgi:diguanylate cyclase (GGDEF)-like protein/PAS domain S-box-containing protein